MANVQVAVRVRSFPVRTIVEWDGEECVVSVRGNATTLSDPKTEREE
jgi:hypothetical protein